jgi:AcrR family transcriptional regulator
MSRPKKTDQQLESTREQILDATLVILQEKGPEAISSRAIAERIGMAHMSLYTYFENQAAILRALRDREMSRWRARQQTIEQRAESEDIAGVVEDLLGFFIAFARDNPNLYRLEWVMPEVSGLSPEESRQRMRTTVGQLAQLLKMGMDAGRFEPREPFLAAGTVLAMVNTPFILFHSGKMVDASLRDRMVAETLSAAMLYLKTKAQPSV